MFHMGFPASIDIPREKSDGSVAMRAPNLRRIGLCNVRNGNVNPSRFLNAVKLESPFYFAPSHHRGCHGDGPYRE
jgi:hypothetical protein